MPPVPVPSDAEAQTARANAAPDFVFVLNSEGVSQDLQNRIFHSGLLTSKAFANYAFEASEFKDAMKDDFEVDTAAGWQARATLSKLKGAWDTCRSQVSKRQEAHAAAEFRLMPKPMAPSEHESMKNAYKARFWELDDHLVPSQSYIEQLQNAVEKGQFRAEPLSEVLDADQVEPGVLRPRFDNDGNLQALKTKVTRPLPEDTEGLRARLTLLGVGWQFLALSQPHNPQLADVSPRLHDEYIAYLLGKHVAQIGRAPRALPSRCRPLRGS